MSDSNYRKGVGIFLINKKKKLWIGKRINSEKFWQMPQGGIDNMETEDEAMKRELLEEIGTNKIQIICKSKDHLRYDIPKNLIKKLWKGKYLGQSQRWFACKFLGVDKDINLNLHKPEFSSWKWIDPYDIMNLVIPFKKEMYLQILGEFKEYYL